MRVLGINDLGKRVQQVLRDDLRFRDVLAVEKEGSLYLYQPIRNETDPAWCERYTEWARIVPVEHDVFRLDHLALSGRWQELDVIGSPEACARAIMENKYHLFFL